MRINLIWGDKIMIHEKGRARMIGCFLYFSMSMSIAYASDSIQLEDGTYVDKIKLDTVEVKNENSDIILSLDNGGKLNFISKGGSYKYEAFPNRENIFLEIKNSKAFEIKDGSGNKAGSFILHKTPGLFKKLIAILVGSALFISIFQAYLKVNKVWKRRKIPEVADSISIVASLMGFAVLFPFLLNSLLISNDYPAAGKSTIGLFLAALFSLISVGYFLEKNQGKGIFRLIIDALVAEKSESTDLISSMLRPHGAKKIIDILIKLAAIDDDIAKEEIDLINQFADKWNINIPEIKEGKPAEVTNLVELKALVQSYLDEKPDTEVAEGLTDLINMMAEADDEITEEESMAVSEFTGMITHYVNAEKGGEVDMFEVNIVPQGDEQIGAIKEILPNLDSVRDRGGEVFKVGKFFSEDYAEAVCEKYIALGLYSNYVRIKAE